MGTACAPPSPAITARAINQPSGVSFTAGSHQGAIIGSHRAHVGSWSPRHSSTGRARPAAWGSSTAPRRQTQACCCSPAVRCVTTDACKRNRTAEMRCYTMCMPSAPVPIASMSAWRTGSKLAFCSEDKRRARTEHQELILRKPSNTAQPIPPFSTCEMKA